MIIYPVCGITIPPPSPLVGCHRQCLAATAGQPLPHPPFPVCNFNHWLEIWSEGWLDTNQTWSTKPGIQGEEGIRWGRWQRGGWWWREESGLGWTRRPPSHTWKKRTLEDSFAIKGIVLLFRCNSISSNTPASRSTHTPLCFHCYQEARWTIQSATKHDICQICGNKIYNGNICGASYTYITSHDGFWWVKKL